MDAWVTIEASFTSCAREVVPGALPVLGDVADEDEVLLQRPRPLAHRRLVVAAAAARPAGHPRSRASHLVAPSFVRGFCDVDRIEQPRDWWLVGAL
jgi:hypothetical protein